LGDWRVKSGQMKNEKEGETRKRRMFSVVPEAKSIETTKRRALKKRASNEQKKKRSSRKEGQSSA